MQLDRPFLRLPIKFDADALESDVRALPGSAWTPHPTGFVGNEAVRLVTPGGLPTDDMKGEMAATEQLRACPYIMQIMAEIGSVWGRSRLMGLGPGGQVPRHVDTHYYWRTHWRIHIPVVTNPQVIFTCGNESVHMKAGECWLFDSFQWHDVQNRGLQQRIHLVLDTVGGGRLRELIESAKRGAGQDEQIFPNSRRDIELKYERVNAPRVMSPWELRAHLSFLAEESKPHALLGIVLKRLGDFADDWAATWAQHEAEESGWADYLRLLAQLKEDLHATGGSDIRLKNEFRLYLVLDQMVLLNLFADPQAIAARVAASSPGRLRTAV